MFSLCYNHGKSRVQVMDNDSFCWKCVNLIKIILHIQVVCTLLSDMNLESQIAYDFHPREILTTKVSAN